MITRNGPRGGWTRGGAAGLTKEGAGPRGGRTIRGCGDRGEMIRGCGARGCTMRGWAIRGALGMMRGPGLGLTGTRMWPGPPANPGPKPGRGGRASAEKERTRRQVTAKVAVASSFIWCSRLAGVVSTRDQGEYAERVVRIMELPRNGSIRSRLGLKNCTGGRDGRRGRAIGSRCERSREPA